MHATEDVTKDLKLNIPVFLKTSATIQSNFSYISSIRQQSVKKL